MSESIIEGHFAKPPQKIFGYRKGYPGLIRQSIGVGVALRSRSFRTTRVGMVDRGLDFIILDVRGLAGVDGGLDFIILNV